MKKWIEIVVVAFVVVAGYNWMKGQTWTQTNGKSFLP
jgi:hypothetical protein